MRDVYPWCEMAWLSLAVAVVLGWKLQSAITARKIAEGRFRNLQESWNDLAEHFKSATSRAERAEAELRRLTDRDEKGRFVRREP